VGRDLLGGVGERVGGSVLGFYGRFCILGVSIEELGSVMGTCGWGGYGVGIGGEGRLDGGGGWTLLCGGARIFGGGWGALGVSGV